MNFLSISMRILYQLIVSYIIIFLHLRRTMMILFKRAFRINIFHVCFSFFLSSFVFSWDFTVYTQREKRKKNDDGVDFVDSVYAYTRAFQIRLEPTRCCYSYIYFSLLFVPLVCLLWMGLHVLCIVLRFSDCSQRHA